MSNFLTGSGRRVPILCKISINGSVEYLGIPDFHRTGGLFWAGNLLAPRYSWGGSGTTTNQNWVIPPGIPYGIVSVPWRVTIPTRPAYTLRIMENALAAACHACDDHLQSRNMARIPSPSTIRNLLRNLRVNWRGYDWDGLVNQYF